jgi:hypothetical protein
MAAFESILFSGNMLSYRAHRDVIAKLKKACGVDFKGSTHACRGSGARHMHNQGCAQLFIS